MDDVGDAFREGVVVPGGEAEVRLFDVALHEVELARRILVDGDAAQEQRAPLRGIEDAEDFARLAVGDLLGADD